MDRRKFLKLTITTGSGILVLNSPLSLYAEDIPLPAVWVEGSEPKALVSTAFREIGGINQFISNGDKVVIKPNIGWDRAPQYAANTNPEVVAAVIKQCFNAGAAKVKIFDRTCNNPRRCYRNSQIEATATKCGAEVVQVREHRFKSISLPNGELLKEWQIYQDYLEADKIINVPIAKHHSLDRVSLGLKNLMGVMGGNRGSLHNHFNQKLIDIDTHILPTLTIIDAYRILLRNGPVGGNVKDVKLTKTLIMSPCTVTADYLALELFNLKVDQVSHIKSAVERGIHRFDPAKVQLKKVLLN